jgi:ABC-type phosphate transport system permease subunit
MQNKVALPTTRGIARATSNTIQTRIDLRKRPRITESLIQGFLFLCGAISILTTIGIVYELSKESLSFFTRELWEDTNKQLAVDVSAQATVLSVTKGRRCCDQSRPSALGTR